MVVQVAHRWVIDELGEEALVNPDAPEETVTVTQQPSTSVLDFIDIFKETM